MTKKRNLTKDEHALWNTATRNVRRQRRRRMDPPISQSSAGPAKPKPVSAVAKRHAEKAAAQYSAAAKVEDLFSAGDPRLDRRVKRGQSTIDATLDLHGHTQYSAKRALFRFLIHAGDQDLRCVLVITGKGGGDNERHAARAGRGIIRMRLREWINEPEFRALIARAAPAGSRHGGRGAFYLFLKRTRKRTRR